MVARFGERSVAVFQAYMETGRGFAMQIAHCLDVLGESTAARWQPSTFNEISPQTGITPAAQHASVEPHCLGSAAGLQLLLEVIGLLVAEGDRTGAVQEAFDLLVNSVETSIEAERRVLLTARGGLLVKVFQLGLQTDWERQQQQLEGVVERDKGIMVYFMLRTMSVLVGAPSNGETREGVTM